MENLRVFINILFVRLGIRKLLPSQAIRSIPVVECGEELVKLSSSLLRISDKTVFPVYVRKTVLDKLISINNEMAQHGYALLIYEAYRSSEVQYKMWHEEFEKMKFLHQDWDDNKIKHVISKRIAQPNGINVGGHQTGGAIDLTICTNDGIELDMGTKYLEFSEKTFSSSKNISNLQMENRNLLIHQMRENGFANFPAEWWHFSFGDSMWAAYLRQKNAIYGDASLLCP